MIGWPFDEIKVFRVTRIRIGMLGENLNILTMFTKAMRTLCVRLEDK